MRLACVLMSVACLTSPAYGQWLDTAFRVPDTFGLPRGRISLAHDPDQQVMYIAGDESDSILAVDDQTYRPVERFSVGSNSGVGALVRPSDRPVLFCALAESNQVVGLDCLTRGMAARYDVGRHPGTLLYCGLEKKLYAANWDDASLSVIDLEADSVVATMPGVDVEWLCRGMVYAPGMGRVFGLNQRESTVVVIDASTDTVIARVKVGSRPTALVCNNASNRVYVAGKEGNLYSIDAATLLVTTVLEERVQALSLACDSARNRVYVPAESTLVVIDGTTDAVIGRVPVCGDAEWVEFDARHNKVIVVNEVNDWRDNWLNVAVVDGDLLEMTRLLSGPDIDAIGQWGSDGNVFCAGGGVVGVYDCVRKRPVGVLADRCDVLSISADSAGGKLYCVSDWPYQVIVVDPATNRVRSIIPLDHYPGPVCFNSVGRKVYVGSAATEGPGIVTVLDGVGDTLLSEVDVGGMPAALAYNSHADVVYAAGPDSHGITVIDGGGDSVVGHVDTDISADGLVYNAALRRLYAISHDGVAVVNARTNRQVKYLPIPRYANHYVLNSTGSRLYIGFPHDSVYVFDCLRDTPVGAIPVAAGEPGVLCYDAADDLLYVGSSFSSDSGSLSVVDCSRNSVTTVLPVETRRLSYDRQTNAVYVLGYRHITAIDGQSRMTLRTFATDFHPDYIASAPGWPSVYVGAYDRTFISVVSKASGRADLVAKAVPSEQTTVVRGSLEWQGRLAVLFDVSGRRVADVHRGANDVGRLAPGVYFVKERGSGVHGSEGAGIKVVVQR